MSRSFFICAVAITSALLRWNLYATPPNLRAMPPHDPPVTVPTIALIAGVRVGYDTMGDMERLLGNGMVYTGGHPGGAREWRLRGTPWYVDSDAFDYYDNRRGGWDDIRVLNDASISRTLYSRDSEVRQPPLPTTRRTRRPLGWLGMIYPGISKADVLRAIAGKLPPPKRAGDTWTWTATGFVRLNRAEVYNTWAATLSFRNGRLAEIDVSCE